MLYIVARSPIENRPHGVSLSDDVNVGFEVFPPGTGNSEADNMDVAPGADYSVAGEYIWKGADQYFFADEVAGELSLIWVSIGKGSASVRTATVLREKNVTGYTPATMLESVDLTDIGIAATFPPPVFKHTFKRDEFVSSGTVNLSSFPVGKP